MQRPWYWQVVCVYLTGSGKLLLLFMVAVGSVHWYIGTGWSGAIRDNDRLLQCGVSECIGLSLGIAGFQKWQDFPWQVAQRAVITELGRPPVIRGVRHMVTTTSPDHIIGFENLRGNWFISAWRSWLDQSEVVVTLCQPIRVRAGWHVRVTQCAWWEPGRRAWARAEPASWAPGCAGAGDPEPGVFPVIWSVVNHNLQGDTDTACHWWPGWCDNPPHHSHHISEVRSSGGVKWRQAVIIIIKTHVNCVSVRVLDTCENICIPGASGQCGTVHSWHYWRPWQRQESVMPCLHDLRWQLRSQDDVMMHRWLGAGSESVAGVSGAVNSSKSNSYHGEPHIPADVFNVSDAADVCCVSPVIIRPWVTHVTLVYTSYITLSLIMNTFMILANNTCFIKTAK